jgi:hypothetical protein
MHKRRCEPMHNRNQTCRVGRPHYRWNEAPQANECLTPQKWHYGWNELTASKRVSVLKAPQANKCLTPHKVAHHKQRRWVGQGATQRSNPKKRTCLFDHTQGWPEPYMQGWPETYIYGIYGIFGREFTNYTVIYGLYIRFWPTLRICTP